METKTIDALSRSPHCWRSSATPPASCDAIAKSGTSSNEANSAKPLPARSSIVSSIGLVQRMRRSGTCSGAGAAAAAAVEVGGGAAARGGSQHHASTAPATANTQPIIEGASAGNCDGAPYEKAPIAGPIRPISVPPPVT